MVKPIKIGQSHAVLLTLGVNVDWDALAGMSDVLQGIIENPQEAGKQFTLFLRKGARVIIGEPRILSIDRIQPFDPLKFLHHGSDVVEQDGRSLSLNQVDLTKVRFEHMLGENETIIQGEERLRRLKEAGYIRLDAKVFQALWEDRALIPESWRNRTGNDVTRIFFDGTIFRSAGGDRYVLFLYWAGGWHRDYRWLTSKWCVNSPSAVLAE